MSRWGRVLPGLPFPAGRNPCVPAQSEPAIFPALDAWLLTAGILEG